MKDLLFAFSCLFGLAAWIGFGYWWGSESVVCPSPCGSYEAGYWDAQRDQANALRCQMPDVPFIPVFEVPFDTANIDHYSNE